MTLASCGLRAEGVSVSLGRRPVLSGITLAMNAGERVAILGSNGSGKTTFLRAIAGLLPLTEGRVVVEQRPLSDWTRAALARAVAVVPQRPPPSFPSTALESVLLGRSPHKRGLGLADSGDIAMAQQAMARLGVDELSARPITASSGGERQRLMLARALVQRARWLILDEPTSAQDPRGQLLVMEVLSEEASRGVGVLAAVHDINLALRGFDRVAILDAGSLLAIDTPRRLLESGVLERAFGVRFDIVTGARDGLPLVVAALPADGGSPAA